MCARSHENDFFIFFSAGGVEDEDALLLGKSLNHIPRLDRLVALFAFDRKTSV